MTTSSSLLSFVTALAIATSSLALAPLAYAEPTAADFETARELFKQGKALRDKGDVKGALEKFKAADALAGTPVTGVELGRTFMLLGLLVEARETFLAVGRIAIGPKESPNLKAARLEAGKLASEVKPRIPSIHIVLDGVPAGQSATVTVDGAIVPAAALGEARKVNPGKHTVAAKLGEGNEVRADVDLQEGETRDVTLKIEAPPSVTVPTTTTTAPQNTPPAPAHSESSGSHISTLTWIGVGVAGVGLLVGTVAGGVALSKTSTVKNECPNKDCPTTAQGDIDSAKTMGTISTIGFITAGAGGALIVIGLLTSGSSSSTSGSTTPKTAAVKPFLGLGSAGIQGYF